MAKKKSNKRFLKRVHDLTQKDISRSIIIASLLFNVLFFAAIFVITSTDAFDNRLLSMANRRYCQNAKELNQRIEKVGKEKAVEDWHVVCVSDEFRPYYKEAIDKFRANISHSD